MNRIRKIAGLDEKLKNRLISLSAELRNSKLNFLIEEMDTELDFYFENKDDNRIEKWIHDTTIKVVSLRQCKDMIKFIKKYDATYIKNKLANGYDVKWCPFDVSFCRIIYSTQSADIIWSRYEPKTKTDLIKILNEKIDFLSK